MKIGSYSNTSTVHILHTWHAEGVTTNTRLLEIKKNTNTNYTLRLNFRCENTVDPYEKINLSVMFVALIVINLYWVPVNYCL